MIDKQTPGTGVRVCWVVGVGARSGIDAQQVRDALDELWRRVAEQDVPAGAAPPAARPGTAGLAGPPVARPVGSTVAVAVQAAQAVYASVRAKAGEPGILAAIAPAQLVVLDPAELAAVEVPTPSERVGRAVGTPSVAEAAALAVARRLGTDARLAVPKIVHAGVTVAAACCHERGPELR